MEVFRRHLHYSRPFVISRGKTEEKDFFFVRLGRGIGEASPYPYYGETVEKIERFLKMAEDLIEEDPFKLEENIKKLEELPLLSTPALSAIDLALHDWLGIELSLPIYRIYGLPKPEPLTSYTISLGSPEEVRKQVEENPQFDVYKVKLGSDRDIEVIRSIRKVTDKRIRVDFNAKWDRENAIRIIEKILPFGIELVEQPVPRDDIRGLQYIRERIDITLIADESVLRPEDIKRVYGAVDGINVKLLKCGGIRRALQMIYTAKSLGMKVMLGCMVETSLSVGAALHLAGLVDYVDLDGFLYIENDPFDAVVLKNGRVKPTDLPGIGVKRNPFR